MSRRSAGQLFVGRLSKSARTRDLEEIFEHYGRLARCDIKYGAEMAYAFVDFEDRRDAEDALRKANGKEVCGSSIVVEWAKGNPRQPLSYDECYKCHRAGHWARDCPEDSHGYRRRSASPKRRGSRSDRRERGKKRGRSRSRSRSYEGKTTKRNRSPSRSRSRSRSLPYKRPVKKASRKSKSFSRSRSRSPKSASRSRSKSPRSRSSSKS